MSKKNILLLLFIAVAVVAIFAFIVAYNKAPQQQDQQQNQTNLNNGKEVDTSDWQTYRNEEYGFELKIPSDWPKFNVKVAYPEKIASASIKLGFLTTEPAWHSKDGYAYIYGIILFTKDQYENYYTSDGGKPNILAENEKYIFTKSYGQDISEDLIGPWKGAEMVFSTFRFIDQ